MRGHLTTTKWLWHQSPWVGASPRAPTPGASSIYFPSAAPGFKLRPQLNRRAPASSATRPRIIHPPAMRGHLTTTKWLRHQSPWVGASPRALPREHRLYIFQAPPWVSNSVRNSTGAHPRPRHANRDSGTSRPIRHWLPRLVRRHNFQAECFHRVQFWPPC
jgi:hypothetical protein